MARWKDAGSIYDVVENFRDACLRDGKSLLWPEASAWSASTLDAFWRAFVENYDESKASFMQKLKRQLADEDDSVHRLAADLLAFYLLYPFNVGGDKKLADLREVIGWKLGGDAPNLGPVSDAFATSVGNPGIYYLTGKYWQVKYFLAVFRAIRSEGIDPSDLTAVRELAGRMESEAKGARGARNILLHLLFPADYERIASDNHKQKIVEAFSEDTGGATDLDDKLANIRAQLGSRLARPDFDFYDEDVRQQWDPNEERPGGGSSDELREIAEFLSAHSLDDERLRSDTGWRELVLPVTRPFLERVKTQLPDGARFYSGGDVTFKRTGYDYILRTVGPYETVVYVGMADDEDSGLQKSLVWGLLWWGKGTEADEHLAVFERLGVDGFNTGKIDVAKASSAGGVNVILYKALGAEELVSQAPQELADEIVSDIQELTAKRSTMN